MSVKAKETPGIRTVTVAAWGVMYHLQNLAEVPKHTLDGFMFVSNSKTLAEAKAFYDTIDLSEYAPKITCPTLVVHGGLDANLDVQRVRQRLDGLDATGAVGRIDPRRTEE
ncbi:hypothetical protein B4Q13_25295, partial [Lacticaseibacillus rhamnosus]